MRLNPNIVPAPLFLFLSLFLSLFALSPAVAQPSPAGYPPAGYELVFHDEFDGSTLDTNKWIPAFFPHWGGPSTSPGEIARTEVSNGTLKLKSTTSEPVWSPHNWGSRSGIMSGMYSGATGSKVGLIKDFCAADPACVVWSQYANQNQKAAVTQYGYFEIRAKGCSAGDCAWWMVGFEENGLQNGEIDVFEMSHYAEGDNSWQDFCIHFGTHKWSDPNLPSDVLPPAANPTSHFYGETCAPYTQWHTYGLLWAQNQISLYIDGTLAKTFNHAPKYPMVTIFNTVIGLVAPDPAGFSQFEIDYFRIYKSHRLTQLSATMLNGSPGWGHVAANAVDDDAATYAQSLTQNWDLELDLLGTFSVEKVVFEPNWANWAVDYQIQSSINGTSWTTQKTVTGALGVTQSHSFATPFAAKYLRINVTAQTGAYAHAIHSVEVHSATPLLQKVSQTATATMLNGTPGWGHVAAHAIDGTTTTYAQAVSQFNWDLQLDLGRAREIGRVVVSPNWANFPTNYRILVSVDGTNWSTVRVVSNGNDQPQTFDFLATGRYVRLDVTNQVGSYPHAIHEFEVYAYP